MSTKDLIESGELELYVAGLLSEERNAELAEIIQKNQAVREEVESIEAIVMRLAKESQPSETTDFTQVLKKIVTARADDKKSIQRQDSEDTKTKTPLFSNPLLAWTAAATFLIFFVYQYQNASEVKEALITSIDQKEDLEQAVEQQISNVKMQEALLNTIVSVHTKKINLGGQTISPKSSASIFWNTQENKVVIDVSGLPKAPESMVYQVWSLTLDPLTPTSIGLLDDFNDQKTVFSFDNPNASQAFGITLEPEGGSATPTLEQLYVLGAVDS